MNIILGTAQLTKKYGLSKTILETEDLKKILRLASKKKLLFIDTALNYKFIDRKIFDLKINKFKILTKIKKLNFHKNIYDLENFKKKLKIKKFDTIFLHDEKKLLNKERKKNYGLLKKLKNRKITKNIGVSTYSLKNTLKIIKEFKIDALQVPGSLFDRRFFDENFLRIVKNNNIKIYFRSIFLQGTLLKENLYKKDKILKNKIIFKKYFGWLKKNKIKPTNLTFGFLKKMSIKNVIIGVSNFEEYKNLINASKVSIKSEIPNFGINQDDNNYIVRPDFWGGDEIQK